VTRAEDMPKFDFQHPATSNASKVGDELILKHLDIDDDPTEDILVHLKDACDWIKTGLATPSKRAEGDNSLKQVGVLVHCTQGISRSGSIIVAYCKHAHVKFLSFLVSLFYPYYFYYF
jgi:dual specificity phosphatase 12